MNAKHLFAAAFLITPWLHAQFSDGVLDPAFDGDGIVQTDFGGNLEDQANAIALQSDGKIVVAGQSIVAGKYQVALARYTAAGALDASFGTGGRVLRDVGPDNDGALAVAMQPDGKIVIAGYTYGGSAFEFLVMRFTSAGALDTSFGTGGKVTLALSSTVNFATSLALQSDGKIVVGGFASIGGGQDFVVLRYTDSGAPDTTFSGDGNVFTNLGGTTEQVNAVLVQPDGKIIAAGFSAQGAWNDTALVRYTDAGVLDTTFGSAGKAIHAISPQDDVVYAAALTPDGSIVLGGSAAGVGPYTDLVVIRCTATGGLDPTFGSGGVTRSAELNASMVCRGLALQSDGRLIAAGSTTGGGGSFVTQRHLSNSAVDPAFSTGIVRTSIGTGTAAATAVAIQPDGRVIVAGSANSAAGGKDFAVIAFRVPNPDIAVAAGSALTDGTGTLSLGASIAGQDGAPVTFTITNPGNAELNSLAITKSGPDAADFEVGALSGTSIPAGGGSVTFTVTFSPAVGGVKTAALQIASNVSGTKNPFDIALTATALTTAQDTDNDGLNDAAEFQMAALGFDWQVAQNALVATYHATANGAGLFTPSQVSTQLLPMPLIQRNPLTNAVTLTIGLDGTPITAPQTSVQSGQYRLEFTSPGNTAFFRLTTP